MKIEKNAAIFLAVISLISIAISQIPTLKNLAISPLIISISIGIIIGNTIRKKIPSSWDTTIVFGAKKILRAGIVLYGLKISLIDVVNVGWLGFFMASVMLFSTFFLTIFVAKNFFSLNNKTSTLIGAGASICGAAAVMATETTIKAKTESVTLAVATVVVYGTIAMFLVPVLFQSGIFSLPDKELGIFIGATVHEVAQVVGAGNFFSKEVVDTAVIVKMTRVILLVPFLILISIFFRMQEKKRQQNITKNNNKKSIVILGFIQNSVPLFAFLFIVIIILNTLINIPIAIKNPLLWIDTFLLTLAMFALGLDTNISKFKNIGGQAFIIAGIAFIWLIFGGYGIIKFLY